MRSRFCFGFVLIVLGTIFAAQPASAQSFNIPAGGFSTTNVCANSSSPATSCLVLTNGSPSQPKVVSGGILQLTSANQNQHGAAWYRVQQPLSTGFTTAFQFQITNKNLCFFCSFPADGLALVIQNDPAGTGAIGYTGNGDNIAYGNNDISTASGPRAAIRNSLAIELDTHQNTDYGDPNGNHIAVQSCGPNNASTLSPNSADHTYICPNGNSAALALQSLPSGLSLSDGLLHTITVNYLPPGTCTSSCNNLSVYFDSTLILQATLNIAQQLNLTGGSTAYVGFTAATGSLAQNNNIVSWSFSQWPLAPITIDQPVQPTSPTNFNYTSNLNAVTDYSQSALPPSSFQGLIMQGTAAEITDQQFSDLVANTPFQGSSCQHQDIGNGTFGCVTTTNLCTTPTNSVPSGANCLATGSTPLIVVSNTYNLDPAQKPLIAPGYIMGKDAAVSCGASGDNTCKGLVSIFTGVSGDALKTTGGTNNFNSVLIPIFGSVQPSTSITTAPPLTNGWTNGNVSVNFNSIDTVPSNNTNPPASLPTVTSINYTATGANVPSPASGTLTGASGSVTIPVAVEGTTTITYAATDSSKVVETLVTNSGNNVVSSTPTFTINVDLTAPTVNCTQPAIAWQATDVVVSCTASDNAGGSGLVGPSSFSVQTNVPVGTETNAAAIAPVTVKDVAGNTSLPQPPQGSFGPFEVDKLAPVISMPTISPSSPTFGQTVTANFSCTDGGSGVVQCGPTGSANFAATASTGPLSSVALGSTGPHTFTVVAQDAVGNQSTPSVVAYTVAQAAPTITWANPAFVTYGTALGATQLNATASVAGTFAYTPAAGTVLTAGTQTLTVNFTPTDTTDYTTDTATVTIVVNQAAPTVTWAAPSPITYGTPLSAAQLNATASVAGTLVYTPAAGTVLTAGTQTLSVSFTPTDANDYTTVTASVQLAVTKAATTITWAAPAAIVYGTPLSAAQLNATANVPGTFTYSPAAGTVLTTGTQMLSVSFTPTDSADYFGATASVQLVVIKATPTITWSNPASIPYGTPLSSTQLNATANVPGTFAYAPAAGTVLSAGTQTLTATFTPSDAVDYTTASKQVTILVTQPQISFSPSNVNFGTVKLNSVTTITVAVSNPGTAPLTISKIAIGGNNEDNDLLKITNNCKSAVAAGGGCSFSVTFSATEVESYAFTILVTDNVLGSPQQISLTATVVKHY